MEQHPPLILYMDNVVGEEVALRVEPDEDFHTFLANAKTTLGYNVDISLITGEQPVSMNDNIYQFLITGDMNQTSQLIPIQEPMQTFDQILEQNIDNDFYVLDDGTQIKASQIHFDNDDLEIDLTADKIPFVKYIDDDDTDDFDLETVGQEETIKFNIAKSPEAHWSEDSTYSFVNTLPFKLACNNTLAYETQLNNYLETTPKTYTTLNPVTNNNKSPMTLISDNYKTNDVNMSKGDDFAYTREEVLNMFKDSPVEAKEALPYVCQNATEKRKHVRKTDPSKGVNMNCNPKPINHEDGILIADVENQNCLICNKFIENSIEIAYVFDNEDQKLLRSSPQRKSSGKLKIVCDKCLEDNFKPCIIEGNNQCLNTNEYLVIKNNQQYVFQKTSEIEFKTNSNSNDDDDTVVVIDEGDKTNDERDKMDLVNFEIGSDGEIVTKPIVNDPMSSDDVEVKIMKDEDEDGSSSDVEIVEPPVIDESIIDNLDDADEEVKEFLGKYQKYNSEVELKCRFCERTFAGLPEVVDHGDEHRHDADDGAVYPCPLCDYGYANSKWLKGHIKAAHEQLEITKQENKHDSEEKKQEIGEIKANETTPEIVSPIAKRTRSAVKKMENSEKESPAEPNEENAQIITNTESAGSTLTIRTEVKQEAIESSDDEIWIVQNGDDTAEQMESLLHAAKKGCQNEIDDGDNGNKCLNCSQPKNQNQKCKLQRGKKRKYTKGGNILTENGVCVLNKGDSVKKSRRRKNKEPSSDPQILTCHNCDVSFTSKVRLKFHMQFHSPSRSPTDQYKCSECTSTSFSTETELFDHVHFQHGKLKSWECPLPHCKKTFHLRATLTKHSRTHTDTRRYVCVTCGKRFLDKQTLDEHGVTHLQIKPFQCNICLKQLTRRSRLRMHLRAHEEELSLKLVLVCAVCSRAFRDQADAQDHTTKFKECLEEFAKGLKEETEEMTATLSPTSGLVQKPVQTVREPPKLAQWIPRQVPGPLAEPLLSALTDEARSVVRVVEIEKAFRCEYCEDVFYLEHGLNTHRKIHKGVKNPFTCHICKVSFTTFSRCTTHKTTHGFYKRSLAELKKNAVTPKESESGPSATGILGYGGFPVVKHFLCEDCGRSYLHWTYLQVHRRMKHANDNLLHKCNDCDATYPNSWSLAYHKKKIHGQAALVEANDTAKVAQRIPCRDCNEVLPNKSALYKHRKKEHCDMTRVYNKSNEWWCVPCGSVFDSRAERDAHAQTHVVPLAPDASASVQRGVVHTCLVCARWFRSASVRDEHALTHTGERPFPCDVCGLAFRRSTAMRNHRLIHSGVRPWACQRCPKRFRIKSDLRSHAKLKHPAHLAVLEGSVSIIPTCVRALSMLGDVQKTPVAHSKPVITYNEFQPPRKGRGIAKKPRKPKSEPLKAEVPPRCSNPYPMTINVTGGVSN